MDEREIMERATEYLLAAIIAGFGGIANHLWKLQRGARFRWSLFWANAIVSSFVGVMVFMFLPDECGAWSNILSCSLVDYLIENDLGVAGLSGFFSFTIIGTADRIVSRKVKQVEEALET